MIKVNLLKDPSARVHRTFKTPTVSRSGLALVAFSVLVAVGIGACYFYFNNQKNELTADKRELQIKEAKLEDLKKQLAKFEEIKQQRQNRIDVIERLKEKQTGPVLLLNHVQNSIPQNRLLWLTSLVEKDNRIKIEGFSQKIEGIPDFMTNLLETGFFKSVDLELVESQQDAARFSLLCTSAQQQPEE